MSGTVPTFPQYAFMAWCSVKAKGQINYYVQRLYVHASPDSEYANLMYLSSLDT
jgi:hypothetical protein